MSQSDNNPRNKKGHHHTLTYILIATALLIVAGMAAIMPMMISGIDEDAVIRIPQNATIQNVEDSLKRYCGDSYASRVIRLLKVSGSKFNPQQRHGAYRLPAGTSPFTAARRLSRGGQDPVRITINGFRSLDYLAERLSRKVDFTPQQFIEAATDSAYLASYGLTPANALSLFIDDSYEVYWSSSPREVLDKIGANYRNFWSPENRDVAAELYLSPGEMMILASIVDDETNREDEKGTIGRLYINRLNNAMKLQADPTVKFALQDFDIRRITREHTTVDSPYNTYRYAGLPPGPLRTTSRATLTAILNSSPSPYLYMCAKEDFSGYHNFAATYQEHVANALRYQHELDVRNIK